MSMINDALKRAKESQRKNNPSGGAPLRPIEVREEERNYNWILPAIIVLLIVVAVFFIALSVSTHKVKAIIAAPEISTTQQVEPAPVTATPVPPPGVIGPAAIINDVPKQVRVQGIFYDPVRPWAIVGGKTVYVGDDVDGMRVAEILRNSITLAGNGQTNKLLVGQ
jgi:hypothetical protein